MSSSVIARGAGQPEPKVIATAQSSPRHLSPVAGLAAFPRPAGRALSPGMGNLDAELGGTDTPQMSNHARERGLAIVGVKPEAAMRDAAAALDVGHLHHQQACPRIGEHAEMGHMPIARAAIVGAVLAHRRDDNAIGELKPGKPDGRNNVDASGD